MIYESKDFTPWNGDYHNESGKPVPDGAYAYLIKLRFAGDLYEYKGSVMVLK